MSGIYGYPTDPAQTSGTVGTSAGEAGTVITEDATQVRALNNAMRGIAGDLGNWREDISAANSTASGSGTAYVLATSSQISALADGIRLTWLPDADNTGAATLNVDTRGAKKLLHDSAVLAAGEIKAGQPVDCVYDASADSAAGAWLVLNPVPVAGSFTSDDIGNDSNITGATVTDALDYLDERISINEVTINNQASVTFTDIPSDVSVVEIYCDRIVPATDAQNLQIRTSSNNGSSYDSGASDYTYSQLRSTVGGSIIEAGAASQSSVIMTSSVGSAAGEFVSGFITIHNPGLSQPVTLNYNFFGVDQNSAVISTVGGGVRLTSADVDAVQLSFTSGNLASGRVISRYIK